jgi:phosphohistidine phosphatase
MRVGLVHHAEAVGPEVDPLRPLSESGHRQAQQLARRAREWGFVPAAIWHSGKLRARQTAEAFLRECNPFAEFRMVRGLRPDDPPDWIFHELTGENRDLLLAGHMPHIAALARMLAPEGKPFLLHGLVVFERPQAGSWRELLRAAPDGD